jgi:hypothetical protein
MTLINDRMLLLDVEKLCNEALAATCRGFSFSGGVLWARTYGALLNCFTQPVVTDAPQALSEGGRCGRQCIRQFAGDSGGFGFASSVGLGESLAALCERASALQFHGGYLRH